MGRMIAAKAEEEQAHEQYSIAKVPRQIVCEEPVSTTQRCVQKMSEPERTPGQFPKTCSLGIETDGAERIKNSAL